MFSKNPIILLTCVILLITGCSEDSAPAPATNTPPKVLTEIEKVICGGSSKTWKITAINKTGTNLIRPCAINDDWIFKYSRILEIKNTGEPCDGQDLFQEHEWDISSDEKNIVIGGSSFLIIKMTSTEMQLQEDIEAKPVFVFKR
jgi:hypothetical protein